MWEFVEKNPFIVGALTGSLATYLLSLIVNYLSREKKVLGYGKVSRKIVEARTPDLEINYRGQPIKVLYSHQVIIRNVGNRPLRDVPVRLGYDGGKLLECELTKPDGADFKLINDNDEQVIVVQCDLLNRKEFFQVGLTVCDSKSDSISVTARAENLICKKTDEAFNVYSTQELLVEVISDMVKSVSAYFFR